MSNSDTSSAPHSPRVAALVGPYLSGKTTLLEGLLHMAGAIRRRGTVKDGTTVGDGAPEARAHTMSTEVNVASTEYLGESWTLLDCPGSVELLQDSRNALLVSDAAIVVCEPDIDKALTVGPLLRYLDQNAIPHMIFINKMDHSDASVKKTLEALQSHSDRPLVLREIPIRDGETVTGHIDLVSERAFKWNEGKASDLVEIPDQAQDREHGEREVMLETLADFDDALLEELLEDVTPNTQEIFDNLSRDLAHDDIVPVFFGSAEHENGLTRLWKALRHEVPSVSETATRLGVTPGQGAVAQVFKTLHAGHAGKLSLARVWTGTLTDGDEFPQGRVSGLYKMMGQNQNKVGSAGAGDICAVGRLDDVATGAVLKNGSGSGATWHAPPPPLYAMAVDTEGHGDDVKLTGTLAKIVEDDPSLHFDHGEGGDLVLWGQGEMHIRLALEKLKQRYDLDVKARIPQVPYRETIRKGATHHARHKKQSGGHGEFGDVVVDIKPLERGEGFRFAEKIHGGSVPRQYIPSVEIGVKEALVKGTLGFPVVDLEVTLTDGQFHAVDSSDYAFKKAGALAMREALPGCEPVLLEPICRVTVAVPNVFTSNAQRIISSRRGQILGFQPKDGWTGWDEVSAHLPQAEMHDLIIDLRSQTLGVGTFEFDFDHLQELSGKLADVVTGR